MTPTRAEVAHPASGGCCRDTDWTHCHGTYVRHGDGGECTDPGCLLPAEAHEHQVLCGDAAVGCRCAGPDGAAQTSS